MNFFNGTLVSEEGRQFIDTGDFRLKIPDVYKRQAFPRAINTVSFKNSPAWITPSVARRKAPGWGYTLSLIHISETQPPANNNPLSPVAAGEG